MCVRIVYKLEAFMYLYRTSILYRVYRYGEHSGIKINKKNCCTRFLEKSMGLRCLSLLAHLADNFFFVCIRETVTSFSPSD